MAKEKSATAIREAVRQAYVAKLAALLADNGETVLRVGTGTLSLPVLDETGNEAYVKIVISVPTGARGGNGWDGYEAEAAFRQDQADKAAKAAKTKAENEAKAARDKAAREAKKADKKGE